MEDRKRATDKFHIDWTLNINTIIALLALLFTVARFGSEVVQHLQNIDVKTQIMWRHFDKSTLSQDELDALTK